MRFVRKQVVELPFILNLPKGNYEVATAEGMRVLRVHHGLYAATATAFEYGSSMAVATKENVTKSFPADAEVSLQRLRTVVERVVTAEVQSLITPKEADLLDEIMRNLVQRRETNLAGEQLKAAAGTRMRQMSDEEIQFLLQRTAQRLTAKHLFREQTVDHFLLILNLLIRQYMVRVDDFFAEEIALHHVASTTLAGVHETTLCEDTEIDGVTTVGKIPPIMRQPWFEHEPQKIETLRQSLKSGEAPDAVALLGIRARSLLERGANRSAIIEAAAALETAIARRLVAELVKQGRSQEDAIAYLHKNQRFSDRCKHIFQTVVGVSLAATDNALWGRVVAHRDKLRHRIVHSDEEPSTMDAAKVVQDFLSLAAFAKGVTP